MVPAQRGDPRVVDLRPRNAGGSEQRAQGRPVRRRFGQQRERRRCLPGIDLIEATGQRRGRRINSRMRHDGKEFVQTRPRDRPPCRSFREFGHMMEGGGVKGGIPAMRVDENVGIDGNQAP